MEQSAEINELVKALIEVQSNLKPVPLDGVNPYFKSKYATLHSVWEECRPLLSKAGLAVTQTLESNNGTVSVVTTLYHTSGQWIKGKLGMTPAKNDPQAIGQIITYFRRYSLGAMLGIVTEEDTDAEIGQHKQDKPKQPPPREPDTGDLMTDKQRKMLWAKTMGKGVNREEAETFASWLKDKYGVEKLTKKNASDIFDKFDELFEEFSTFYLEGPPDEIEI